MGGGAESEIEREKEIGRLMDQERVREKERRERKPCAVVAAPLRLPNAAAAAGGTRGNSINP